MSEKLVTRAKSWHISGLFSETMHSDCENKVESWTEKAFSTEICCWAGQLADLDAVWENCAVKRSGSEN